MFVKKIAISNLFQGLNMAAHLAFGLLMAYYFGATKEMDAYVVAVSFMSAFSSLFSNAQQSSFIPFISQPTDAERNAVVSAIARANFLFFSLLAVAVLIGTPWLVKVLAPGLSPSQMEIAGRLMRVLSCFVLFNNLSVLSTCLLDYHYRFELRYFVQFLQTLVSISVLVTLVSRIGIDAAAWSTLMASIFFIVLSWWLAWKRQGVEYVKGPLIKPHLPPYAWLLMPVILSSLFVLFIRYSETFVASFLKSGSLSYINYCSRIEMYMAVVSNVVSVVYFPVLSRLTDEQSRVGFLATFKEGLQLVTFIAITITGFVLLFAEPIVKVLFERGSFSAMDTLAVSRLIRMYSLVYICGPLGMFLSNVYFCYRQSKMAMAFSIVSSVSNIGLIFLLGFKFGILGIGAAASVAYLIGNVLQIKNIRGVNPEYRLGLVLSAMARPLFAGMMASLLFLPFAWYWQRFIQAGPLAVAFLLASAFILFIIITVLLNLWMKTEPIVSNARKLQARFFKAHRTSP